MDQSMGLLTSAHLDKAEGLPNCSIRILINQYVAGVYVLRAYLLWF